MPLLLTTSRCKRLEQTQRPNGDSSPGTLHDGCSRCKNDSRGDVGRTDSSARVEGLCIETSWLAAVTITAMLGRFA